MSEISSFPVSFFGSFLFKNFRKTNDFSNSISVLNIKHKDIYFLPTKEKKLDAINDLNCYYFIDDLPEILKYINNKTERILYLNNQKMPLKKCWDNTLYNWNELPEIVYKNYYG